MSPKPERVYDAVVMQLNEMRDERDRPIPFAVHELVEKTGFSYKAIVNVLETLRYLGFVFRMKKAFNHRIWKVTRNFTTIAEVKEAYETHKLVKG